MARTKSKTPICKERLLQVLVNGGPITKRQIELTMQYKYMYRIPAELWKLKSMGAVIKSHKKGRDVYAYELLNVDEMKKVLSDMGYGTLPLVKDDSQIKNLGDLKAESKQEEAETVTE